MRVREAGYLSLEKEVLPVIVSDQVDRAKAESANLRAAASEFPDRPAYTTRLTQAAQMIDVLVSLLEIATFTAKLNHDTIAESRHDRADSLHTACAFEGSDHLGGLDRGRSDDARAGLESV